MIAEFATAILVIGVAVREFQLKAAYKRRIDDETFACFARASMLRAPRIASLADRATEIAERTSAHLGLNQAEVSLLMRAIALRDLGLCSVSYRILNERDPGTWSEAERDAFRAHLATTDELLGYLSAYQSERETLRQSEGIYWLRDGQQTPSRVARVLKAVCDYAFFELAYGCEAAGRRLIAQSGREYEPTVVDAVLEVLHSDRVRTVEAVS